MSKEGKNKLVSYSMNIFDSLKSARYPLDGMWKECSRNYRREYREKSEDTLGATDDRRSKVFVGLTDQKVHTVRSTIVDAMINGREVLPYSLKIEEDDWMPGWKESDSLGYCRKLKGHIDNSFLDIRLDRTLSTFILGLGIFGSQVMKDPVQRVRYERVWNGRKYRMIKKPYFTKEIVHLLNYYADFTKSKPSDGIMEIQFEKLLPAEFQMLSSIDGYDKEAIKEVMSRPAATLDNPDDNQQDIVGYHDPGKNGEKDKGYYVYECWGMVPRDILIEAGVDIPAEIEEDNIEVLATIANKDTLIKCEVNTLGYRPFLFCPFDETIGQAAGQGPAWAVRDMQTLVNVFTRMLVDSKKLTSQGMVGMVHSAVDWLKTGSPEIRAKKIWYFKPGTNIDQAMKSITFQDVSNGLPQLIEMFLKFADDETVPKYTQGGSQTFLNKTASGISMLLTQSRLNLKPPMRNIDLYVNQPCVERTIDRINEMTVEVASKQLRMESFAPMPIKVIAQGMDSLMAKEIKHDKLVQMLQMAMADPQLRRMIDPYEALAKIADNQEVSSSVLLSRKAWEEAEQKAAEDAKGNHGISESVNIASLYPTLLRSEQTQVLDQLGIKPGEAVEAEKKAQLQEAAQQEQQAYEIGRMSHHAESGTTPPEASGNSQLNGMEGDQTNP